MSWTTAAAALAASLALCAPAAAADGDLDGTFDYDGIEHLPFGEGAEVALTPGGQIIAVSDVPGSDTTSYVARLTATGSFDPSFNDDGLAILGAPGGVSMRDVVVQPDGRILVAGIVEPLEDGEGIVFRLTPDGDLDPSFAGDGSATFDFGDGHSSPRAMALRPDGRIVVVGQFRGLEESDFGIARLNADGTLDTTFAGDGTTTVDLGKDRETASTVVLQGDAVVAAGISSDDEFYDFAAIRLLANGSRDGSFDVRRTEPMSPADGIATPDGGLLFAVNSATRATRAGVLKLDGTGHAYPGFSPDGVREFEFGPGVTAAGADSAAVGISETLDGNYVLVGTLTTGTEPNLEPRLAALKITPSGFLVPSFGDGGRRIFDGIGPFRTRDLLRQPDGKLVVGGDDREGMAVARIIDGTPTQPPAAPQPPVLNLTGGTVSEGQVLVFTATLSRPIDVPVTVDYITGEGTAATGIDFGGRRGTVTIPPGQTSAPIGIATNADRFFENPEDFRVELSNPVNARFGEYVAFGTIANVLRSGRCQNIVLGNRRGDILTGSAAGDLIVGRADSDVLFGLGGHDCIRGERGHDIIDAGDGNDLVDGGSGDDQMKGGDGNDRLYGRRGVNRYNGGAGNDRIYARNGRSEIVECGSGRDTVKADRNDRLRRCERVSR